MLLLIWSWEPRTLGPLYYTSLAATFTHDAIPRGGENIPEEDTGLAACVDFADGLEHHIPVWSSEVGGRAQTSDGIAVRVGVVNHDVGCIVRLDLRGKVL